MLNFVKLICACVLLLPISLAQAAMTTEVLGVGSKLIPVSIAPLGGDDALSRKVTEVVVNDLTRSGLFKIIDNGGRTPTVPADVDFAAWRAAGADALSIGSVALQNGRIEVRFRLMDVNGQKELLGQMVAAAAGQERAVAHRMADMIYEKLTGHKGVFSTRIAFVNREKGRFRLIVADSDGHNEQAIVSQSEPLMSPAWSPDGSHLAYVSFEGGNAKVYVQSLFTNQRLMLAGFKGSNSAPAWAPDGRRLAVVLTRDGDSEIYLIDANGKNLRRLTFSGSIDTEPHFSPDGQYLLFTSDRGGNAQIYRMPVEGGAASRVTFGEGSSFSPRFSPDGKSFVYSNLIKGRFYIAIQDIASGQSTVLTQGGWEKRPSFAPNGRIILFANESRGRGILATVSSDGRVKQHMFAATGDAREPIWGPY